MSDKMIKMLTSDKMIAFLTNVGIAVLVVIVGYIFTKLLCKFVRKALIRSAVDDALIPFIINCMRVFCWILILVTALGTLGISPAAFITAIGAAGVAVALALQNSLANFAGGILIILTKPYGKGDYIEDYQTAGKVEKIDLLYTTLTTFDNKTITVPNGKLANSTVVNFTRAENRRVDCTFSIGYHNDIGHAKDVLLAVAEANSAISRELQPIVGVANHSDSSISIDLKVWCKTDDYWDVKYFLEENVKVAFDEAGISIPFPQMDVHVKR